MNQDPSVEKAERRNTYSFIIGIVLAIGAPIIAFFIFPWPAGYEARAKISSFIIIIICALLIAIWLAPQDADKRPITGLVISSVLLLISVILYRWNPKNITQYPPVLTTIGILISVSLTFVFTFLYVYFFQKAGDIRVGEKDLIPLREDEKSSLKQNKTKGKKIIQLAHYVFMADWEAIRKSKGGGVYGIFCRHYSG